MVRDTPGGIEPDMRWSRIMLAAAAGGAAFLLTAGAYYAMLAANLDLTPLSGGGPPRPGQILVWYVGLLLVATIAGALPARVVGASWGPGLLASLGAHLVAAVCIFGLIRPSRLLRDDLRYDALALLLGAVLTVLAAAVVQRGTGGRMLALVAAVAVVLTGASLVAPGHGLSIAALAWLVLPAIAVRS